MLTLISLVLCLSHKCEPSSSSLSSVPFLDREYCTDQTELSVGRGTILNFHVFVEDFVLVYYFPRQRARDCKWQLPIKLNDYSSTQRLFLLADTAILDSSRNQWWQAINRISVCYLFLSRGDNDLVHDTPHDNTLYQFALEFRDFSRIYEDPSRTILLQHCQYLS